MRSTLFHISNELFGLPLLGFGVLLAAWAAVCAVRIGWLLFRRRGWPQIAGECPMMLLVGAAIAWILPALADSEGLPIRGYGLMVFFGVAAAVGLAVYRAKRAGYDPELIYALALWLVVAGIVGARLFYVIEYWEQFSRPTLLETLGTIFKYTEGGLVVYGAFLGGAAAAVAFFVRHRLPVLRFLDLIAPSVVLGLAVGRIGCFLNGCCYGGICDLPWAVTFPGNVASPTALPSPPYISQASRGQFVLHGIHFDPSAGGAAVIQSVDENSPAAREAGLRRGDELISITVELPGIGKPLRYPAEQAAELSRLPLSVGAAVEALSKIHEPGTRASFRVVDASGQPATRTWTLAQAHPVPERSLPIHPTQLYSAIGAFLLTFFLLAWSPIRRHDGELTALTVSIYPIMRILEEAIRHDEPFIGRTGMTISQNVSVLLLAVAVAIWIFVLRSPRIAQR